MRKSVVNTYACGLLTAFLFDYKSPLNFYYAPIGECSCWVNKEMRAASQRPAFFSFLGISFV